MITYDGAKEQLLHQLQSHPMTIYDGLLAACCCAAVGKDQLQSHPMITYGGQVADG